MALASPTRSSWWIRVGTSTAFLMGSFVLVAASVSGTASARARVVSVDNSTISCTKVTGLARFDPRLRSPGTVKGLETVHLNLALSGCSSSTLPPPITVAGQLQGALVANTGTSCSTSLGTSSYVSVGTLTVDWKVHGAKISRTSSFSPQRVRPEKVRHKASARQSIKVGSPGSPRPSVVGDFAGGNDGKTSSFSLTWDRSAVTCSTGLHDLPIISGTLAFS